MSAGGIEMKTGHLYSVSDKAIFDAINNSKVTNQEVFDLFFSRGILISKETKRRDLAEYYSRLTHGYHDFQMLYETLGTTTRREKSTSCDISNTVSKDQLTNASEELCKKINSEGNRADSNILPNGDIEIVIRYSKLHLEKSELRQTVNREAVLIIESHKEGFTLRTPLNEDASGWKEDLLQKIQAESSEVVTFGEITLEHIQAHELRTEFFTTLIQNIGGNILHDVTDVYVYHPKAPGGEKDPDFPSDSDDEVDFGVHITKASLKGEGVLQSEELNGLYEKGFYIWKIVWRCKEPIVGSDMIECEAQFANPAACADFSYITKGFYRYKTLGVYNTNRNILTYTQEKLFLQQLEARAKAVVIQVSNKASGVHDVKN
jgi:hypothetical protein